MAGFRCALALPAKAYVRSLEEGGQMAAHRIFTTAFASVYPLYLQKAERKGRTST
ncbi:DUF2200 family protein [Pseudoxanthomonas mexicana]